MSTSPARQEAVDPVVLVVVDGCSPSSSFIDKFVCLPDEFPGNQVDMAFEQAAEEWALGGRRRTRQALLVGNKVDAPKRKKSRGSVHDVDATIRLLEEANAPWRQEVDERERERGMLEQEVQRVTEAADVKASSDAREIRRLSNSNVLVGAQVEREKKKRATAVKVANRTGAVKLGQATKKLNILAADWEVGARARR